IPIYYDDDDDEESSIPLRDIIISELPPCIAITPVLLTEEPVDSLIMEDKHLDTIPATESDEVIKSSVEDLVHTPSESDGISESEYDLPVCDDSSSKKDEVLDDIISIQRGNDNDHFNAESSLIESVLNHDNMISSPKIDFLLEEFAGELALIAPIPPRIVEADFDPKGDILMTYEDIDYVDASPPDSELVSLEEVKDFHPKDGKIEDDILREKLSKINLLIAKIKALNTNPTPSSDFVLKSPIPVKDGDSFLEKFKTTPKLETFKFDIEEKNSGSTTIHAGISLPDLEYFYFKSNPDPGELTSIVDSGIRKNVLSMTNVNLPFEDDQSPLFAYVVWIFLPFLTYPVTPPYLLSCGNEDTFFDPDISVYHSFMPSVSHRSGTFMKFNVYPNHLNESLMEILSSTCSPWTNEFGVKSSLIARILKPLVLVVTDNNKRGFGYTAVPSPHPLILNRPTPLDLSYSGLEEFKQPEVNEYGPRDSSLKPTNVCNRESNNSKENTDNSLTQQPKTGTETSSVVSPLKVDKAWREKFFYPGNHVRVEEPKKARENTDAPIIEDWVSADEEEVESIPKEEKKADVPIATKKESVKTVNPSRRSVRYAEMYRSQRPRGNHRSWNGHKSSQLGCNFVFNNKACFICGNFDHIQYNCPNAYKHMVPRAVLMRTGLKTVKNAKPLSTDKSINTVRPVSTDRPNVNTVRARGFNVSNSQLNEKGFVDSGCSRHMSGNIAHLLDFKEFDGGYVTFGGGANGGRITGKQHRALEVQALVPFTKPLFMLHMDLFGPTFVSSLMHKKYCLVVTDDYSRFSWVFFLRTKDETSEILKNFIKEIENLVDKKVKIIRSDNGTEFKNHVMDEFCREKGIKREYSVARTPQQNGVAERKNRTLIEAARTMLADSKLPTTFWAEAVSTACYVQNRVLVVKPHNKTPYELFRGIKPAIEFMKPFEMSLLQILNTLDKLGKFDGKSDEGFFVGYSLSSKAFRVYNIRTRKVQENLHVGFLENKPMLEGNGPKWLFDLDSLTQSMNYVPVVAGTFSNVSAGIQGGSESSISSQQDQDCIFMPIWKDASYFEDASLKSVDDAQLQDQDGTHDDCSFQDDGIDDHQVNTASPQVNTGSRVISTAAPEVNTATSEGLMGPIPTTEDTQVEDQEIELGNISPSYEVSSTPHTRIHKDHPIDHVIGDVQSSVQTRRMTTSYSELGFVGAIYEGKTHQDLHTCLFACFLSQEEPKRVSKALSDPAWVEAMQEELL
ncbi:putative ribonuclease H-like domain-containing protein, partial [Tanacetum coccineum]